VKKIIIISITILLFFSCKEQRNISCIPQLNLDAVGIMDTITVVVEGKIDIPELQDSTLIVCLSSKYKDYSAKVDSLGNFKFSHIEAGHYLLGIQHLTHINFVTLKSGGIYKAFITCNKNKNNKSEFRQNL